MNTVQPEIDFNPQKVSEGKAAMLVGIKKAEDHANAIHDDWSNQAYEFMLIFLRHSKTDFMVEDVRAACKGVVPEAPTSRAWGAIILRAAKAKLVKKVGIRSVKNSNAHRANAAVWTKL
jgi:hypothetical protein